MDTRKAEFESEFSKLREDMAKRDVRLIASIAVMMTLAVTVLGFIS